jgi:hypothetical protein
MKTIQKENAFVFYISDTYYCIDKTKENKNDKLGIQVFTYYKGRFLKDITINDEGKIHSYNDQPLIYKEYDITYYYWFQNGKIERENPEKPYFMLKNKRDTYYKVVDNKSKMDFAFSLRNVMANIKKIKIISKE